MEFNNIFELKSRIMPALKIRTKELRKQNLYYTEEELFIYFMKIWKNEFNLFKKHNQRHRYGTIESYQGLLKELNDRRKIIVPNFHIIGHSLDKADYNILKHIFKARENVILISITIIKRLLIG